MASMMSMADYANALLRDTAALQALPPEVVYPVTCDCGWFGMRDDCAHGECPNCGDRVRKERP